MRVGSGFTCKHDTMLGMGKTEVLALIIQFTHHSVLVLFSLFHSCIFSVPVLFSPFKVEMGEITGAEQL
jgi:hypothetical protein